MPILSILACVPWLMPPDASAHGPALDRHLALNLWIAVGLLLLAHLILFAGLLIRRRADYTTPRHHRRAALIEYLPLAAFTLLFRVPSSPCAPSACGLPPPLYSGADPAALQVEATGMQFAWYFRYPGPDYAFGRIQPRLADPGAGNPLGIDPADPRGIDDILSSTLVLPANREVDLHLHAQDVIHGFSVPALHIKQNAVPGEDIHIHFTPTVPGTYAILCTQLCGAGHYRMTANLALIVSPSDYQHWLNQRGAP